MRSVTESPGGGEAGGGQGLGRAEDGLGLGPAGLGPGSPGESDRRQGAQGKNLGFNLGTEFNRGDQGAEEALGARGREDAGWGWGRQVSVRRPRAAA